MAGKKNGSGAAWLEELKNRPVLCHWFLRGREQLAWPSGWGRASCEMGTRAGGVLSQLLHAPTEALAEGAASGAFPRSVVPKASIWTWGIPQNCHTVTVHVCKITHTWVPNGSSLAKELGLCNGVAEVWLYFPFFFLTTASDSKAECHYVNLQNIFSLMSFKGVDKIQHFWI